MQQISPVPHAPIGMSQSERKVEGLLNFLLKPHAL